MPLFLTFTQVVEPPLPEGWAAHITTTRPGRTYYYHKASKTTTWKRPTEEDVMVCGGVPAPSRSGSETERSDRTPSDREWSGRESFERSNRALAKGKAATQLGLKWVSVGATAPANGRELTNAKLSFALRRKTEFTAAEMSCHFDLALYELPKFHPTDYIHSGTAYFQPDATHPTRGIYPAIHEGEQETGLLATPRKDGEEPGQATSTNMSPPKTPPDVGAYGSPMEA